MTRNHVPPMKTSGSPARSSMARRFAASDPSTTAGYCAEASFRNVPAASPASSVSSRCGSVATTAIPPVRDTSTLSVRRTVTFPTTRVAAADSTGPMRRIIAGAVVGRVLASPNTELPGSTCNRLVPNSSSSARRSALLDAEMPTTATMAAIPMAMPRAVRTVRARLARSPPVPTASTSRARKRDEVLVTRPPRRSRPGRRAARCAGAGRPRPAGRG